MASTTLTASAVDDTVAPLPYPPRRRTLAHAIRQYNTLLRVVLAEYRATWFFHSFFNLLLPLGFIFFFKTSGQILSTERAIFLLGGNMATSIAFGPTFMLTNRIGWQRQNREFDYWATLPVPKLALIMAIISVALVFALPGLLGVYLFGSLLLDLPLRGGWLLIPLVPLSAISLAGLGVFLGTYAKDGPTASILANILIIFVGFLSPLLIPIESLPAPLRFTSFLMPTTYAADAFRAVLSGTLGMNVVVDVVVLMLFLIVFTVLVHYKLDWRAA